MVDFLFLPQVTLLHVGIHGTNQLLKNPGIEYLVMFLLLPLGPNGLVVLGQKVGKLLVGRLLEHGLLPQVGGEEGVGLGDGGICSFS